MRVGEVWKIKGAIKRVTDALNKEYGTSCYFEVVVIDEIDNDEITYYDLTYYQNVERLKKSKHIDKDAIGDNKLIKIKSREEFLNLFEKS